MKMEFTLTVFICSALVNWVGQQVALADETPGVADENKTAEVERLRFTVGVRTIFQDSGGDYWFGSHGEGLCRYDGEVFEYFTTKDGLADNHILSIQEDSKGTIWVDTQQGVSRNARNGFVSFAETQQALSPAKWTLSLTGAMQEPWRKSDADLWFSAGTREGVFRYDGQQFRYLPFPHAMSTNSGNAYVVTGFSAGKDNVLWIGTYAGVFGYNGDQLTIINDETLGYSDGDDRVHVRCLLEDSKGRLWIGNNGIGVLLKEGESIVNFSRKHDKLVPIEDFESNSLAQRFSANVGLQSVFAIEEDSQGNIWFGDRDSGAWRYDVDSLVNFTIDEKLESQMIWDIHEDQSQNLLFAMAQGGVYQFNGSAFDRRF
ncbi:MAG: diguanylate cyclase [bacterium]|nr:diguanylate cyclase [bacterium]